MEPEKRREPRYNVRLKAQIRNGDGNSRTVKVTNLSRQGCRFKMAEHRIGEGAFMTITVERVGFLEAQVKWRKGDWHGIRFDHPLHPAVLDHMRLFLSSTPALVAEAEDAVFA